MAWGNNKEDEENNPWANQNEDPNRFAPPQSNPYAGMTDNYGGGSDYNSAGVQRYSDADVPVAYVPAQTPPYSSSTSLDTYTDYNNTPAGLDARDRGGVAPKGYTYTPDVYDGKMQDIYKTSTPASGSTKKLEDLPKVGVPTDKGANIVSPANSGSGNSGNSQPQRSGGGGGGYQPQQQYQSQPQRQQAPAGWDERAYLTANPDVARAIQGGIISDGYSHYMANGKSEGRSIAPAAQRPQTDPMAQTRADAQAQLARMQAEARAQQQAQQQTQQRNDAQRQMMSAKVVGTGAGGEQIVRFTEGVPRGYTPDFDELSRQTGLGAASLMRAYRDQGGDMGGERLGAGGSTSSAGATGGMGATSPRGNAIIDAQGFNDAAYLAQNPDVADAVRRGEYKSGFDHWAQRGRNEVRPGGRELNEFEKANPWAIGVQAPEGGWKLPTTTPTTPAATTPTAGTSSQTPAGQPPSTGAGADKYLSPEQRAGGTVAPGSIGTMPQPYTPPTATDNTGTNYTGGAGGWEYDPLRGEWVNGTTGETRPWGFDPNAQQSSASSSTPTVATDGSSAWQVGINPFTGKPYTPTDSVSGAGEMRPEPYIPPEGFSNMPTNPMTGRPYTPDEIRFYNKPFYEDQDPFTRIPYDSDPKVQAMNYDQRRDYTLGRINEYEKVFNTPLFKKWW